MCFTERVIFILIFLCINRIARHTCLAPERFKKSIRSPWPKKVVHHWNTYISILPLRDSLNPLDINIPRGSGTGQIPTVLARRTILLQILYHIPWTSWTKFCIRLPVLLGGCPSFLASLPKCTMYYIGCLSLREYIQYRITVMVSRWVLQ